MYKKQVRNPKSTTVISSHKRKPKVSQNKKVLPNETKQSERHESMCPVNEKIHFNNDVPEQVQDFIKKISTLDCERSPPKSLVDENLLNVKDQRLSRRVSLPCSDSDDELAHNVDTACGAVEEVDPDELDMCDVPVLPSS